MYSDSWELGKMLHLPAGRGQQPGKHSYVPTERSRVVLAIALQKQAETEKSRRPINKRKMTSVDSFYILLVFLATTNLLPKRFLVA